MNISEDFNHKIIIHAVGKYQIQLLALIYANINKNYNQSFKFNHKDLYIDFNLINNFLNNKFENDYEDNIKTNVLYCPKTNVCKSDGYTIHTKNNLERFLSFGNDKLIDSYIMSLQKVIKVREYKLINMKTFLELYSKYLFKDINDYNNFINKYSMLENTNIFKLLKQIKY